MLTEKEQQALEHLELERERRINEKLEKGAAVLKPPTVLGGPQDGPRAIERDDGGREIYRGHRTKEGAIDHLDTIITGVPRAERDPDYALPNAGVPTTAELKGEGVVSRVHTVLGERDLVVKHQPQPKPQPDTSGRHYRIRVTISPTSERDCGFQIDGTFTVSDQVRVYDMGGKLIAQAPFKPGDDIEALARKLLRAKSIGGSGFYGALNYPPRSFH
jgi:hypothetical protein